MIKELGDTIGSRVLESLGRTIGRTQERRPLPVDLLESDDAYLAVFDAPGAMKSDVQVRYDDGAIVVRIDRFREFRDGFEMQFPGRGLSLDGRVELPSEAAVDPAGATATLKEDGTLHVRVPKRTDGGVEADEAENVTIGEEHTSDSNGGTDAATDTDEEADDESAGDADGTASN